MFTSGRVDKVTSEYVVAIITYNLFTRLLVNNPLCTLQSFRFLCGFGIPLMLCDLCERTVWFFRNME